MRILRFKRQKTFSYLFRGRKNGHFAVPTFVLKSRGKLSFPSLFLYAKAVQTSEMPNLFEHFATNAACFRTQCKSAIFLAYYNQLLSTKCIEIVYSFLEKRKSNEVSFDLAGKKKIIMAKPFLLLLYFLPVKDVFISCRCLHFIPISLLVLGE